MKEKVSVILIVYHEEDIIERALKSVKEVADEIIVVHDGPCMDNTLKIAKNYTHKIYEAPRKKRAALHLIYALKKCKNDWVFKLDADEFLSKPLQKDLNRLAQNKKAAAYTFRWLIWEGNKYVSKDWPHKKSMFRKSRCSFIQFPGWDEPRTKGETIKTDYLLEHRPPQGTNDVFWPWKKYWNKAINRYGKTHAEWTLKDFEELEKYHYDKSTFPLAMRIRRKAPVLSAIPFAILAFFKTFLSDGAWKEGWFVYKGAAQTAIYYIWLGMYLHRLKYKRK